MENWEDYENKDIQNKLKSAGFTNIKLEDKDEFSKEKNSLVAEIALNGMSYYGEKWYVPTTTLITITYYTYKIRIGANESSFWARPRCFFTLLATLCDIGRFLLTSNSVLCIMKKTDTPRKERELCRKNPEKTISPTQS